MNRPLVKVENRVHEISFPTRNGDRCLVINFSPKICDMCVKIKRLQNETVCKKDSPLIQDV